MDQALKWLEGRKTTLLVLVAMVLIAGGAMTPEQAGLDFTNVDSGELLKAVFAGMIGSIKAGVTRVKG